MTHHPWLVETKSPTFYSNVNKYRAFCSEANATPGTDGHWYSYSIYLPEGYDLPENEEVSYPVVYWLHESIDKVDQFRDKQGASRDRVQKRHLGRHILPVIYVFPYGGIFTEAEANEYAWIDQWTDGFTTNHHPGCDPLRPGVCFRADSAFDELIEHIESNYRVIDKPEARALEGFSRGGGFTLQRALRKKDGEYFFGSAAALSASEDWEYYRFDVNARALAIEYAQEFPNDEDRPIEFMFLFGAESLDQAYPPMTSFSQHLLEEVPLLAAGAVDGISHVIEEVVPACGEEPDYPAPCAPEDAPPPLGHDWLRMDEIRGDAIMAFHQAAFERLSEEDLAMLRSHRMPCADQLSFVTEEPVRDDAGNDWYLAGDWNGDACDTLAIRYQGEVFIDNDMDDVAEGSAVFGPDGADYFAIDWRDSGSDEIGWAEFSTADCPGAWEIRFWTEDADGDGHGPEDEPFFCFEEAPEDTEFIIADFDGDWKDDIAYRVANELWWTPYRASGYNGEITGSTKYGSKKKDDAWIAGDWDFGQATDSLAVRRENDWLINYELDGAHNTTQKFGKGAKEDQYLVGDWDGDGRINLGVRRCNQVLYDINYDGAHDYQSYFGWGTGGCYCDNTC